MNNKLKLKYSFLLYSVLTKMLQYKALIYIPILSFWSKTILVIDLFTQVIKSTMVIKNKKLLNTTQFINSINFSFKDK